MGEMPLSLLTSAGGEGAEVVYALRNDSTLANLVLDNIGNAGQIKRKVYQRRLPEDPSKDYYYIIRETNPNESILIEYGFIDNPNDLRKLQTNLDKYAEGVVKAIADYTNTPYTLPGENIISDYNNNVPIGDYYIVKRGDSLYSISKKFNISVDELKRINNLTSNIISVGQQLIIPKKIDEEQKENPDVDLLTETYIVQKGDSLWSISQKLGINVDDLIKYNNLTNPTIYIGQVLKIPTEANLQKFIPYTVVRGDTLWSIAKRYNITVDDIVKDNNLISPILSIGQKLLIRN